MTTDNQVYTFIYGEADEAQLRRFEYAIKARRQYLREKNIPDLYPGCVVRTTGNLSPKYMLGLRGTVIRLNQKTAVVKLDNPVMRGRFFGVQTLTVPMTCLTPTGDHNLVALDSPTNGGKLPPYKEWAV